MNPKHLKSAVLMVFAAVVAVMSDNASAQMSMRQQAPMTPQVDMNARQSVGEEQWINSIVDHWTGSQRSSWRSLDRRFCGWVSHLVWVRKTAGRPSGESGVQGPHVPSACPVDAFVAPAHSVAESMEYFREVMPDMNWNAWANIDPTFRSIAEWEMSGEHAKAQIYKALKDWWTLNNERVQACFEPAQLRGGEHRQTAITSVSMPPSSASPLNQSYELIEHKARSERSAVEHMIAPEPIKQEARAQISDAATVDKYIADVDRCKP
ncbi:MAG: hypothetical protein M3N91_07200 [Pseudomonadota bacterium]|nr:hypothetical protein [Pseudomonadota bacterium]